MTCGHLLDRILSLLSGMVFRGTNLDPMFAAADANDGDLTSGIYNQHGGDGVPTLKQCRRRYRDHRSNADAPDAEPEEPEEPAVTPGKKGKKKAAPASAREGASTQTPYRDTPHQAEVKSANAAKRWSR